MLVDTKIVFISIFSFVDKLNGVQYNEDGDKMKKEELINITIDLINENGGDVSKVTMREITARTGVSLGLINYHFGNKDNLITECVQKIIRNVVTTFTPKLNIDDNLDNNTKAILRLKACSKEVFEFLFKNPSISKISILNDYNNYIDSSNSNMTIKGFMRLLSGLERNELEKERLAFHLTNNMQIAFLRSLSNNNYLGYDFSKKEDRNKYIDDIIDKLI